MHDHSDHESTIASITHLAINFLGLGTTYYEMTTKNLKKHYLNSKIIIHRNNNENNESRKNSFLSRNVWHGINPWHEKSFYNCDDWNSDNPLHVGLASSLEGGLIAKQKKLSCNKKNYVLCIEM